MSKKKILYCLFALVALVIILYSLGFFSGEESYNSSILKDRQEKAAFMKRSSASPLSKAQKENFKGLDYFPPNSKYKVNARLTLFQTKETVTVPNSDNTETTYIRYGFATFDINDTTQKLLLLHPTDENDPKALFLAFTDKTSGNETYGGGRYLDLTANSDSRIIIDFNKAYSPYCMYNENYSCPFPPRENHLEVAIMAGEMTYENH